MSAYVPPSSLGHWIRTDLGVRIILTRLLNRYPVISIYKCLLHRRCLPGCGPQTSATRDIQTTFIYRLQPPFRLPRVPFRELSPAPFPWGGGGFLVPSFVPVFVAAVAGAPIFANVAGWYLQE